MHAYCIHMHKHNDMHCKIAHMAVHTHSLKHATVAMVLSDQRNMNPELEAPAGSCSRAHTHVRTHTHCTVHMHTQLHA